ncbi:hypothetical protein [Streptomyces sp. NPDC001070]
MAKRQMLAIDQLEVLKGISPLEDPVLWHEPSDGQYLAIGFSPAEGIYLHHNFGRLPLGDESPTWVYLIDFHWHGERFVKIGIGLDQRIRDHELQGGQVLQKVQLPRWQARAIERAVLDAYPRHRPLVPLPQHGDTECLVPSVASQINLRSLAKALQTRDHTSA